MSILEENSTHMVIRRSAPEDWETLKGFIEKSVSMGKYIYGEYDWLEFPLAEATYEDFIQDFGNGHCLLGFLEGALEGLVVITKRSADKYKHVANVTLNLSSDELMETLGKELIQRMILTCKGKGIVRKINLRVREDHFKIQEIYKSMGFYEEGSLARDVCLNGMFYSTLLYGRSID